MIEDYLGSEIKVGQRGVRVGYKHFSEFVVKKIHDSEKGACVGILSDGNTKLGWTYPNRIIVETSFKTGII
jgi:hypothetical protein